MTENLQLNTINIPYGILHDQLLLYVNLNDDELIFTFEISLNEKDYCGSDFYERYKSFNRCDMIGFIFKVEFFTNFYYYKDMKKYRKYTVCKADLEAESVSWNWYRK